MHIDQVIGDIDTRFALAGSVTFIELTEFEAIVQELVRLRTLIEDKETLEDILAEESANEFFMEHMYDD
jgi:hypothetical protein